MPFQYQPSPQEGGYDDDYGGGGDFITVNITIYDGDSDYPAGYVTPRLPHGSCVWEAVIAAVELVPTAFRGAELGADGFPRCSVFTQLSNGHWVEVRNESYVDGDTHYAIRALSRKQIAAQARATAAQRRTVDVRTTRGWAPLHPTVDATRTVTVPRPASPSRHPASMPAVPPWEPASPNPPRLSALTEHYGPTRRGGALFDINGLRTRYGVDGSAERRRGAVSWDESAAGSQTASPSRHSRSAGDADGIFPPSIAVEEPHTTYPTYAPDESSHAASPSAQRSRSPIEQRDGGLNKVQSRGRVVSRRAEFSRRSPLRRRASPSAASRLQHVDPQRSTSRGGAQHVDGSWTANDGVGSGGEAADAEADAFVGGGAVPCPNGFAPQWNVPLRCAWCGAHRDAHP